MQASSPTTQKGVIFDVKKFAIHDGPGIRTTVFLKGCPLRCRWCHNPESWQARPEHSLRISRCVACRRCVEACPRGAIAWSDNCPVTNVSQCVLCGACVDACPTGAREILGREATVAEVMAEIERDVIFYDQSGGGATFSGGEPLVQIEFLGELLRQCKAKEIHTALDTTCYAPWEAIESIAPYVDLFLCDLKHLDAAEHERFTGVSNELILENLRRLTRMGGNVVVRMAVIPGVNDDDENMAATAEFIASLDRVAGCHLLPYNEAVRAKLTRLAGDYDLLVCDPPSGQRMEAIARRLRTRGLSVEIGG